MKTILWSILCLFLSGWGSMQTVSAQDLQEMEKNLSAINEDLNQRQKNIVGSLRRLMQIIVKQTINI